MLNENIFYDHELEKGFITSILSNPELFDDVAEKISIDSFNSDYCSKIFYKMQQDYFENGEIKKTEIMLYSNDKFGQNKTEEVLENSYHIPFELETIVSKLNELKDRRMIKDSLNKSYEILKNTDLNSDQFKSQVQDEVFKVTSQNLEKTLIYDVEEVVMESFKRYHERQAGESNEKIRTGFRSLDSYTGGGLSKKHLSVLAGRPSMGKTSEGLCILSSILETSDIPCLVISLEMDRSKLMDRVIIQKAKVSSDDYYSTKSDEKNRVVKKQGEAIQTAINWIYDKDLKVTDRRGLNINDIKSIARKTNNLFDGKLGFIMIDYLTEINVKSVGGRFDKGTAEAVRELRSLAAELDLHIMLLHQINRDFKNRANKRPQLSDLRDSGEIEEKADNVFFVHRPDYYEAREKGVDEELVQDDAEFIIAKQREGSTGVISMTWYSQITYFQDYLDKKVYGPINYLRQ